MVQELVLQFLQTIIQIVLSDQITKSKFPSPTANKATETQEQTVTIDVCDSFDGLLLHLVVGHGGNPEHHLLLRNGQQNRKVEVRAVEGSKPSR
jgi:hypothetical protein